jgi:hypothetical protein
MRAKVRQSLLQQQQGSDERGHKIFDIKREKDRVGVNGGVAVSLNSNPTGEVARRRGEVRLAATAEPASGTQQRHHNNSCHQWRKTARMSHFTAIHQPGETWTAKMR